MSETPTGGIGWPEAMDQPISERNVDGCGRTLGDWQDAVQAEVIRCSGATDFQVDGSGEDSGDPLDLTLTEIGQGFACMEERISALEEERDDLQTALQESEARVERLQSLLERERGRGAVVARELETLVDAVERCAKDRVVPASSRLQRARSALSDPSPAATALLELAEAAVRAQREGWTENGELTAAAIQVGCLAERYRVVHGG